MTTRTVEYAAREWSPIVSRLNLPDRVRRVLKASWQPLTITEIMERADPTRPQVVEGLDWLGVSVERVAGNRYQAIGAKAPRRDTFRVHHDRSTPERSIATFRDVGRDRGIPERVFSTRPVGAPSSYSPTVATAYVREREAGKSHLEAARVAGRAGSTIREWMKVHPEFRERVDAVRKGLPLSPE